MYYGFYTLILSLDWMYYGIYTLILCINVFSVKNKNTSLYIFHLLMGCLCCDVSFMFVDLEPWPFGYRCFAHQWDSKRCSKVSCNLKIYWTSGLPWWKSRSCRCQTCGSGIWSSGWNTWTNCWYRGVQYIIVTKWKVNYI